MKLARTLLMLLFTPLGAHGASAEALPLQLSEFSGSGCPSESVALQQVTDRMAVLSFMRMEALSGGTTKVHEDVRECQFTLQVSDVPAGHRIELSRMGLRGGVRVPDGAYSRLEVLRILPAPAEHLESLFDLEFEPAAENIVNRLNDRVLDVFTSSCTDEESSEILISFFASVRVRDASEKGLFSYLTAMALEKLQISYRVVACER